MFSLTEGTGVQSTKGGATELGKICRSKAQQAVPDKCSYPLFDSSLARTAVVKAGGNETMDKVTVLVSERATQHSWSNS